MKKKKREEKKRIIYSNYNLWEDYAEYAKKALANNGIKNPTEDNIWDEICFINDNVWSDIFDQLVSFFEDGTWIAFGTVGRWDGTFDAGVTFGEFDKKDFKDVLYGITKCCDYVEIFDTNGHFYLQCHHHDGTNSFEIKRVTDTGEKYLENWENNWDDERSEQYVHNQLIKRYSTLPHFVHKEWGLPKIEKVS